MMRSTRICVLLPCAKVVDLQFVAREMPKFLAPVLEPPGGPRRYCGDPIRLARERDLRSTQVPDQTMNSKASFMSGCDLVSLLLDQMQASTKRQWLDKVQWIN